MSAQVVIRLDNVKGRIEGGVLPMEVANEISSQCSYEIAASEYMKRQNKYKYQNWDGTKRLYHRGHRTFPAGLYSRIAGILDSFGIEHTSVALTERLLPDAPLSSPQFPDFQLRPYQTEACIKAHEVGRCMIRVATGGGKTVIAGHLMAHIGGPILFFVHTKDLLYQAKEMFQQMFSTPVGQVGDGVIDPQFITVCTLQTAARALDIEYVKDKNNEDDTWQDKTQIDATNKLVILAMLKDCEVLFMDECHRVACVTAQSVVDAVPNAQYRFGLSASPWRDDGADIVLEGCFGQVEVNINATELIEKGYLVTPYIRMVKGPIGRFPKKTPYTAVYDEYIVNNDERNGLGVSHAKSLMSRGLSTLVLVRQIAHGAAISERLGIPFLSGKDDSSLRNSVLNDLRANRLAGLVATTIADEGLDVKPLAGLVLLGAGKSSTRALQRVGRVLRPYPGKTHAEVIDFEDNAKYLFDHSKARLKIYESEPGFTIYG
jgi:superfamily II DNA or RNA helicase